MSEQPDILGLFREPDEVADALDALRGSGLDPRRLKVLSGHPYPKGTFGEEEEPDHLFVFPFAGAICGFVVGILITIGTQMSYPLVTGGKPLISVPPMMNVLFEGTMLGAIIFSVLGAIMESRLPHFARTPYDPRLTEGYLGILVEDPGRHADRARGALRRAGAVDLLEQ